MHAIVGRSANREEADVHMRLSEQGAAGGNMDEATKERQLAQALRTGGTLMPEQIKQRQKTQGLGPDTGAVARSTIGGGPGTYIGPVRRTPEERAGRGIFVDPAILNRRAAERATTAGALAETEAKTATAKGRGVLATAQGTQAGAEADVASQRAEILRGLPPEQKRQALIGTTPPMTPQQKMDMAIQLREADRAANKGWLWNSSTKPIEDYYREVERLTGGGGGTPAPPQPKPGLVGDVGSAFTGASALTGGAVPPSAPAPTPPGFGPTPPPVLPTAGPETIGPPLPPTTMPVATSMTVGQVLGPQAGPWAGRTIPEFTAALRANPRDPALRQLAQALRAAGY
jgi:hypothetical protein